MYIILCCVRCTIVAISYRSTIFIKCNVSYAMHRLLHTCILCILHFEIKFRDGNKCVDCWILQCLIKRGITQDPVLINQNLKLCNLVASGGCPIYSKVNTIKRILFLWFVLIFFTLVAYINLKKCFSVEHFYGLILCFVVYALTSACVNMCHS